MGAVGLMLAYAVVLWWASTGLILWLNHLPERTYRWSMAGSTLVALAALAATATSAADPTVHGAYLGFTAGVLIWGWHEMSFFMGIVTGPRRTAGPPEQGWRRFRDASQTCLYHDAAIALTAAAMLGFSAGRPNHVAAATFIALWLMRLSAKLNVFLGVRNLNEQFIPPRLGYLKAYLRQRRMNPLLPLSLLAGTAATAWFARAALAPAASPFTIAANFFVAAILALGVIEHAFLVIPLPFAALWSAFLRTATRTDTRTDTRTPAAPATHHHIGLPRTVLPVSMERS